MKIEFVCMIPDAGARVCAYQLMDCVIFCHRALMFVQGADHCGLVLHPRCDGECIASEQSLWSILRIERFTFLLRAHMQSSHSDEGAAMLVDFVLQHHAVPELPRSCVEL